MQQAKRSFLGLFTSILVHGVIIGALLWNWNKSDDSVNSHSGELATAISMEMLQGMRIEEPVSEPEKIEPEPEKKEIVADPTKKAELKKKEPDKKTEKPKDKPKPPKEKTKKEVKPAEKTPLPKNLPIGERNVNASANVNSKATTTAPVNTNANTVGGGSNINEIAAYKAALYREIERRKEYPTRAKMMRKQGIVHISFNVSNDGVLSGGSIVKSSGDESLDNAALKAVRNAKPVGPKPQGFSSSVSVPIRFSLQ